MFTSQNQFNENSPERGVNESFSAYKIRRKKNQNYAKSLAKGRMKWNSGTKINPKKKKELKGVLKMISIRGTNQRVLITI